MVNILWFLIDEALKRSTVTTTNFPGCQQVGYLSVITGYDKKEAILQLKNIPDNVTKLQKYFDWLFPNWIGGNQNPGIHISFNFDWENLQKQVCHECSQNNIYLYLKLIHNGKTGKYYLQNFHPDEDLKFWTEWFKGQMQTVATASSLVMANAVVGLKLGLISHPINDNKKFTGSTSYLTNQ